VEETVFIRIVERPSEETVAVTPPKQGDRPLRVGVSVTDMVGLDERSVVVTGVVPGSAAHLAGVRRGDQIKAVGAHPVHSSHQFVEQVGRATGDLALLIERQGRTTFIVVEE